MLTEPTAVLETAMRLPLSARAFVAEKLLESLDTEPAFEVSEAWGAEIRRRCQEVDAGEVELISSDDAFARAFAVIE